MTINLLLFGACREAVTGQSEMCLEVAAPSDVRAVWQELVRRHPALGRFDLNVLFAVNEEYARIDQELVDGDTLAIFPPVSGG
ncbi:MAG: MoaD/ThiS family protein [Acidobacteria bacterium]|nr:MoaD/ThiS family protein [Acidobacteriota bacterium]